MPTTVDLVLFVVRRTHGGCAFLPGLAMLVIMAGLQTSAGARIMECTSSVLQVPRTGTTVITCDQLSPRETIEWTTQTKDHVKLTIGYCYPDGRCDRRIANYVLTRERALSNLTIPPNHMLTLAWIRCGEEGYKENHAVCPLDNIHRAEVSPTSCVLKWILNETWNISGSCQITKVSSSRNNYRCEVFAETHRVQQPTLIQNYSYSTVPDGHYRRGSCSFSYAVSGLLKQNVSKQELFFRFTVYPGPTQAVTGPVIIEQPASPSIGCPSVVGENSSFTCTCSTNNIGQPPGRLYWSRDDVVQKEADYGVTTLTTEKLMLFRPDNGLTKLSCGIRWEADIDSDFYTANVGFPPSAVVLTVNSNVSESLVAVRLSSNLNFTCTAEGGNPSPVLVLFNSSSPLATGSSPLTYSLGPAQVRHSGLYRCKANNAYGGNITTSIMLIVDDGGSRVLKRTEQKLAGEHTQWPLELYLTVLVCSFFFAWLVFAVRTKNHWFRPCCSANVATQPQVSTQQNAEQAAAEMHDIPKDEDDSADDEDPGPCKSSAESYKLQDGLGNKIHAPPGNLVIPKIIVHFCSTEL